MIKIKNISTQQVLLNVKMAETFYCRLCADLKSILEVVYIREDGGINITIYEKVLECFQVEHENSFPSSVCKTCWVQATTMYDLYKKVLFAQYFLSNFNQENIQTTPKAIEDVNIKIEIEETNIHSIHHSIDVKPESVIEFGIDQIDGSYLDDNEDLPIEIEHANIVVKIEEEPTDSVNLKHKTEIEFGKENYLVLGNKQGKP